MMIGILLKPLQMTGIVIICMLMLIIVPVLSIMLGIVDHLTNEKNR